MHITRHFLTLLFLLLTSTVFADTQQLMEQLRADHAVLLAAEEDFHSRRERGVLNGTEASDYAGYIAGLHRRVAEDCLALTQLQTDSAIQARKQTGERLLTDRLCPEQFPIVRPAAIDQAAEQTRTEQIAALDAELSAGLGEFDELLLREQERVKAATPPQHSGDGAGGAGGSQGEGKDGEGDDEADQNAAGSKGDSADAESETNGDSNAQMSGTSNGQSSGARGGTDTSRQVATGQPADIPDGSDDDVVARQLREAAEKETDPELKKKLWEEYKKYKQGTR